MKKIALVIAALPLCLQGFAQTAPAEFKTDMSAVFAKYLDVEDALQAGDPAVVKTKAAVLLSAAQAVKTTGLGYNQTMEFNKDMLLITANANLMIQNSRLDSQLKQLDEITAGLYPLMKEYKIADQPTYYDYCPMANKGGGAHWLASNADVKNPYMHGEKMGCEKQQDQF
jgi:hypothetical protein